MKQNNFFKKSLNRICLNHLKLVTIDENSILKPFEDCKSTVESIYSTQDYCLFQYHLSKDFSRALFESITQKALSNNKQDLSEANYLLLCDALVNLQNIALIIYQANLLNDDDLQLIKRLLSFSKRNKLDLQIVLIGPSSLPIELEQQGLIVDRHYMTDRYVVPPRKTKKASEKKPVKEKFKQKSNSNNLIQKIKNIWR